MKAFNVLSDFLQILFKTETLESKPEPSAGPPLATQPLPGS